MKTRFFYSPSQWRKWLQTSHDKAQELWVGFYKRASGKPSITWPEAVDQALCFGWIDGLRKSIDDVSYRIRFTPRKPGSIWSDVNIKRVGELSKLGLMQPAGLQAFRQLKEKKSRVYSYEQRHSAQLSETDENRFRADRKAWEFFQSRAPWYRRTAIFWVVSAKKDVTRSRRLATLIESSRNERTIPPLTRKPR